MGGTCNSEVEACKILFEKIKERDLSEGLGMGVRVILKWMLRKQGVM
jgi:hypothetical protein